MLPKSQRLTREELKEVKQSGRRKSCDDFLLSTLPYSSMYSGADSTLPTHSTKGSKTTLHKGAVVVSKKVATTAVKRNMLRRAGYRGLQEAFSQEALSQGGKPLLVTVVLLPKSGTKEPKELQRAVAQQVTKILSP